MAQMTGQDAMRAGEVVATTPPATATLNLPGRPGQVSFQVRA